MQIISFLFSPKGKMQRAQFVFVLIILACIASIALFITPLSLFINNKEAFFSMPAWAQNTVIIGYILWSYCFLVIGIKRLRDASSSFWIIPFIPCIISLGGHLSTEFSFLEILGVLFYYSAVWLHSFGLLIFCVGVGGYIILLGFSSLQFFLPSKIVFPKKEVAKAKPISISEYHHF